MLTATPPPIIATFVTLTELEEVIVNAQVRFNVNGEEEIRKVNKSNAAVSSRDWSL